MPPDSSYVDPWMGQVVRDSRGRFIVAPLADHASFAIFDSSGRFVRTVGRKGHGPGEYGFLVVARTKGDSIVLGDVGARRLTYLTSDGEFVETVAVAGQVRDILFMDRDRVLVHAMQYGENTIGQPFYVLERDRSFSPAFGADTPAQRPPGVHDVFRNIAPNGKGGIWSAQVNRYEIEEWTATGSRTQTLVREIPWFVAWATHPGRADQFRPVSSIMGIQRDARGLLWVFSVVADANWRASSQRPADGIERRGDPGLSFEELDNYVDTMVDVIDPVGGVVLASHRYGERYVPSPTPGYAYRVRDRRDIPDVVVYSFSLARPAGPAPRLGPPDPSP